MEVGLKKNLKQAARNGDGSAKANETEEEFKYGGKKSTLHKIEEL